MSENQKEIQGTLISLFNPRDLPPARVPVTLFLSAINVSASAIQDRVYWETCVWTVGRILWPCWPLAAAGCILAVLAQRILLSCNLKWWALEILKIAWCKAELKLIGSEISSVLLLISAQPYTWVTYHSGTGQEVLTSSLWLGLHLSCWRQCLMEGRKKGQAWEWS